LLLFHIDTTGLISIRHHQTKSNLFFGRLTPWSSLVGKEVTCPGFLFRSPYGYRPYPEPGPEHPIVAR
jgi:hypothetical protein